MRQLGKSCCGALCLVLAIVAQAAAIPSDDLLRSLTPTADVNDFAHLLTPAERESLELRAAASSAKKPAPSLPSSRSLHSRAARSKILRTNCFAQWKIGREGQDNGILLLVAMEDRQSRIEVGYGLEPIIPDVLAGRILDHKLRPEFRQQKYAAGLTAAVDAVSELVEKDEPADRAALDRENESTLGSQIVFVLFLALFVAIGGFLIGHALGSKQPAALDSRRYIRSRPDVDRPRGGGLAGAGDSCAGGSGDVSHRLECRQELATAERTRLSLNPLAHDLELGRPQLLGWLDLGRWRFFARLGRFWRRLVRRRRRVE